MRAWLTPNSPSAGYRRRVVFIPDSGEFEALFVGAMYKLAIAENYEAHGALTPEEAANEWANTVAWLAEGINMDVGQVGFWAYNKEVDQPEYFALCDGRELAQTDYPALYEKIGAAFGAASVGNFKIPSLVDRFIVGVSVSRPVGSSGGQSAVALTVNELPSHTHEYYAPIMNIDIEPPVGVPDLAAGVSTAPSPTSVTGGGQAHENEPPYLALYPIIRIR